MTTSVNRALFLLLAVVSFGVGVLVGVKHPVKNTTADSGGTSLQQEMDAHCAAALNDQLSKLSADDRKGETDQTFFSRKLHTCVLVDVSLDPKNAGAMNYVVSDLTYGFIAPPRWHHNESPLHVIRTDYGNYHHLHAEGYWAPVSSDPGQQPVSQANKVKLDCDYTPGRPIDDDSNVCTETEAYTQFSTIDTDTQTYHIASWNPDEVIATSSDRGLTGTTTTTLLIHPTANEIEVVDRTRMDEKQPSFSAGMAGKSFGDHYELHGGMYLFDTEGIFFNCNEDGVVTDMRFDVVQRYHGDVVYVPKSEWNAGSKANHKFTQQECEAAMQTKLTTMNKRVW